MKLQFLHPFFQKPPRELFLVGFVRLLRIFPGEPPVGNQTQSPSPKVPGIEYLLIWEWWMKKRKNENGMITFGPYVYEIDIDSKQVSDVIWKR